MKNHCLYGVTLYLASGAAYAVPAVTGNTISWPDDGWYQVQVVSDAGITEICQGGRSCEVTPGEYIVINHTANERFEGIFVTDADTPDGVTVTGNTISWPDDGWYQVQDETDYAEACSGTRSCTVTPGSYVVINHTTGQRFEGITVENPDPVNPTPVSDDVTVVGSTISWPDNGWYQVQESTTFETLCSGSSFCSVPLGTYIVINHTTGARFENVLVPASGDIARSILDRHWILSGVEDNTGSRTAVFQERDFEFTVRFSSEQIALGDLSGQLITPMAGINVCNFFSGGYSLESNVLVPIAVSEDARACERAPEVPARIFNSVLFSGPSLLAVDSDELVISSGNNQKLYFSLLTVEAEAGDAPRITTFLNRQLLSTRWNIQKYSNSVGEDNSIPVAAEWTLSFIFDTDIGTPVIVVGFGPCTFFYQSYFTEDTVIRTQGSVLSPEGSCTAIAELRLPELEQQVATMFRNSNSFLARLDSETTLTIQSGTGEQLVLTRID